MKTRYLQFNNISYKYETSPEFIFKDINLNFPIGWTGIIGANGSGKTTLLELASEELTPTSGSVQNYGTTYYCKQRTDFPPPYYQKLIDSYDKESFKILDLVSVKPEWFDRWESLSHGERKRCQIATALYSSPDILVVDEPTNHIDNECREILIKSLKTFKGIGLIVSHDRELLNQICNNIVSLREKGYKHIHGNYDIYEQEMEKEFKHLVGVKTTITKEIKKIEKEVKIRRQKVTQSDSRISKRNISRKDHDTKSKLDAARLTGKDAIDNKKYSQLKSRMDKMIYKKNALDSTAKRELGVDLEGNKFPKSVIFFKKEDELKLKNGRTLVYPDLLIGREDKIGIVGNNGSGKTSLINAIVNSGSLDNLDYSYIPQEITAEESEILLKDAKSLNRDDKGKIFTIISRLNSDPKRLLDSQLPSPGEVRKLMLALSILQKKVLIIMDEPTNHMDLPSIQCVEEALYNYYGSVLLVSHDNTFLNKVVNIKWSIESVDNDMFKLNTKTV
ncbi:MAG: ATP-binding cassette domain-containing protein, partial [Melioribacteraceae bacterium]|nr:ATP-binding cassette domain-containing protein [Melioribacteraceae bacterium]